MNITNDIKIISIDSTRPPRVRKESYIDLYFKLSQEVPSDWGEVFNVLGRRVNPSPKMDKASGDCIQTYVNNMDQIAPHLLSLKKIVLACNQQYQEKLDEKARKLAERAASLQGEEGEQFKLNQIIAALEFDT